MPGTFLGRKTAPSLPPAGGALFRLPMAGGLLAPLSFIEPGGPDLSPLVYRPAEILLTGLAGVVAKGAQTIAQGLSQLWGLLNSSGKGNATGGQIPGGWEATWEQGLFGTVRLNKSASITLNYCDPDSTPAQQVSDSKAAEPFGGQIFNLTGVRLTNNSASAVVQCGQTMTVRAYGEVALRIGQVWGAPQAIWLTNFSITGYSKGFIFWNVEVADVQLAGGGSFVPTTSGGPRDRMPPEQPAALPALAPVLPAVQPAPLLPNAQPVNQPQAVPAPGGTTAPAPTMQPRPNSMPLPVVSQLWGYLPAGYRMPSARPQAQPAPLPALRPLQNPRRTTTAGTVAAPARAPIPATRPDQLVPWPGAAPIPADSLAPPPTLQGIARKLGEIEGKSDQIGDTVQKTLKSPDWGDISGKLGQLVQLILSADGPGEYAIDSPCEVNSEGDRLPARTAAWGASFGVQGAVVKRLDALAELLQHHKDLKQPGCKGPTPAGEVVTVQFEEQ